MYPIPVKFLSKEAKNSLSGAAILESAWEPGCILVTSFRPTCQFQDVCLYSDTMAALKPYCFEPERAGNSEDDESGDD